MSDLSTVLSQFEQATGLPAVIWSRGADRALVGAYGHTDVAPPPVVDLLPPDSAPANIEVARGHLIAAAVPGHAGAWLGIGPVPPNERERAARHMTFLLPVVAHYFQATMEVQLAAHELAERYEEINLLYTTSEILGHTVSLEEAAARILAEISETVGAKRAAILVHDRVSDTLQVVSASGFDPRDAMPIAVSNATSVTARVFREQRAVSLDGDGPPDDAEAMLRVGALMAVPILWTNPGPHGAVPLGVVTLSDRRNGESFGGGDEKLVSAIATQIGTAIQNARLVRASLAQQRLQQEMQLASDLQMKLLPDPALFAPEARIAARVVPAESVGGDFYQLFRLGGGKTGVMIGDVSSHGYRAALIMALVMSASSIHAQSSDDPAVMLNALLTTLRDELESTEMFISIFYAVIDPVHGTIRYANAGHPHAFVLGADGDAERLGALDPPLGMSVDHPSARQRSWHPMRDVLLLFTDGVSDARNRHDVRLGEQKILDVIRDSRDQDPHAMVEQAFSVLQQHAREAVQRDDLTLMVVRG